MVTKLGNLYQHAIEFQYSRVKLPGAEPNCKSDSNGHQVSFVSFKTHQGGFQPSDLYNDYVAWWHPELRRINLNRTHSEADPDHWRIKLVLQETKPIPGSSNRGKPDVNAAFPAEWTFQTNECSHAQQSDGNENCDFSLGLLNNSDPYNWGHDSHQGQ
ncbi:hypothetical protein I302_105177 [Kwoniella bestiolae CBS 10118]|uniref:Uncharacterized protein n=1 Tax=Kwoniella bestiolae CBS 10118 TaxID=1296100 RepID=A0AAJ8MA18_9TREE